MTGKYVFVTEKDAAILNFVANHDSGSGAEVSLRQIAEFCGFLYPRSAHKRVKRLEDLGLLRVVHQHADDGGWAISRLSVTDKGAGVVPGDVYWLTRR